MKFINLEHIISSYTSNGWVRSQKMKHDIRQFTTASNHRPMNCNKRFPLKYIIVLVNEESYVLYEDGFIAPNRIPVSHCREIAQNKLHYTEYFNKIPGWSTIN